MAPMFPDGVFVIELAAVGDPAAVPEAVRPSLGITQQPGDDRANSVAAAWRDDSRLLVFDNCEHVLDAAAEMIEAILTRRQTVRSSRPAGRVCGWPTNASAPAIDRDEARPRRTLFVERAHAVAPRHLARTTMTESAVVEICRRLDGIPLAIELAASRMQSMTLTEVRDRLDDRFRLLVGSRRGLERHQTLRHAVQWSYDLLDDAERSLLARCSVFAGGFDLAGARAVAGSDDEFATLDLLDALVRKSLWLPTDRPDGPGSRCWRPSVNSPKNNSLPQGRPTNPRRARSLFAGREADVLALWDSPSQRDAYTWFEAEMANLRTAFRWAADHDDLDTLRRSPSTRHSSARGSSSANP